MATFYHLNPWKKLTVSQWLSAAEFRVKIHPNQELLQKTLNQIKKVAGPSLGQELIEGKLHFDLHAGNILYNGKNVSLIDWEVSYPGLLLIDVFDAYRRYINKNSHARKRLIRYLEKQTPAPKELNTLNTEYQSWVSKEFQAHSDLLSDRSILIIYAIERTLLYYERWQSNRLEDHHGFEKLVIESYRD